MGSTCNECGMTVRHMRNSLVSELNHINMRFFHLILIYFLINLNIMWIRNQRTAKFANQRNRSRNFTQMKIKCRHTHWDVFECRICGIKMDSLIDAAPKIHLQKAHGLNKKHIDPDACAHFISRRRERAKALKKLHHIYFG